MSDMTGELYSLASGAAKVSSLATLRRWEGWEFISATVGPGRTIPDLRAGVNTVTLVANPATTATVDDGLTRKALRKNDILFSSGRQLQLLTFGADVHLHIFSVERNYMRRLLGAHVENPPTGFNPIVQVHDAEISQSMLGLASSMLNSKPVGRIYFEAYANLIVLRTLGRLGFTRLHSADYNDPLSLSAVKTVLDHMYEHVGDPSLRAAALAQIAGLPVDVFRHRFRKSLGQSVHQSLMDIRMEMAAHYLTWTSRCISQIAMDTGFADHSHFSKAFRHRVGTTPSVFRETSCGGRRSE